VDSREALEELQGRIKNTKAQQKGAAGTLLADMLQFELCGLEYASKLLKEVIEYDRDEALSHLADSVAQEYYNSQED
jgi:hypothetical protein